MMALMFAMGFFAGTGAGVLLAVWWRNRPEPPECAEPIPMKMINGDIAHLRCYLSKGHKGPHR